MQDVARAQSVELDLFRGLKRGSGGTVSVEDGIGLLAESLVSAAGATGEAPEAKALATLLELAGSNRVVRGMALECLKAEATSPRVSSRRPRFKVARRTVEQAAANIPARISFWHDHDEIRTAAINQTATVAERLVRVSGDVVDDLTTKMTDPAPDEVGELCDLLYRLLIPSEFRGVLDSGPLVFEVDRAMAQLNWEMLATGNGAGVDAALGPAAVRAAAPHHVQPGPDAAPAPGRGVPRAHRGRPRGSGERRRPPRRTQRGAEGEGDSRRQAGHRGRREDRRTERPARRRPAGSAAGRPARGALPAPPRRLRPRPLRGARRLRPREARSRGLGLRARTPDAGRDRPHRTRCRPSSSRTRASRPEPPQVLDGGSPGRGGPKPRPGSSPASRTSSSSSASATTSARPGR